MFGLCYSRCSSFGWPAQRVYGRKACLAQSWRRNYVDISGTATTESRREMCVVFVVRPVWSWSKAGDVIPSVDIFRKNGRGNFFNITVWRGVVNLRLQFLQGFNNVRLYFHFAGFSTG